MCLIVGASFTCKTEVAKSWFKKPLVLQVGALVDIFPAKMREYKRTVHDGIVLDDVRDLEFLNKFQHVFQGKWNQTMGFSDGTPGGAMAYDRLLFKTPFVATANFATKNLAFLESNDWLNKSKNVWVLRLTSPPFEETPSADDSSPRLPLPDGPGSAEEEVRSLDAPSLAEKLRSVDLCSAAGRLQSNDVNGADFLELDESALTRDLGFSRLLARKVLRARAGFLNP